MRGHSVKRRYGKKNISVMRPAEAFPLLGQDIDLLRVFTFYLFQMRKFLSREIV